ncbi:MAG: biopolymer transporter ExbD [Planctomycetaceae bacterium]
MPIQYRCPQCRKLLSIGTRMAGHQLDCPACGAPHVVPAPQTPTEPSTSETEAAAIEPDGAPWNASATLPAEPVKPFPSARPTSEDDDEEDELELRRFDRESDEMDLTPMVDCVFLLLIFFMITASFTIQKTIEVPPPDPDKRGATQSLQKLDDLQSTSVVVSIDERNAIAIDDVPLANPDGLADALRDRMTQDQKNELVIEAHASAFHETVIAVVDAANEVQFQKIRLATTPGTDTD